jgi:hypothetical protein
MSIPAQSLRNANRNQSVALNSNLDKRLLAYIAAAGAAGVSALSLAPQAEAKVVVTKTNETIVWGTTTLDLDNDGKPEFKFVQEGLGRVLCKSVYGYKFNHVAKENDLFAAALAADFTIGRGLQFSQAGCMVSTSISSHTYYTGPWVNVKNRFLGLEFRLSDGVHFGWARITFTAPPLPKATLTAYAYETIPEKSIVTGRLGDDAQIVPLTNPAGGASLLPSQPTLGMLAAGAPVLTLWRKEEETPAN